MVVRRIVGSEILTRGKKNQKRFCVAFYHNDGTILLASFLTLEAAMDFHRVELMKIQSTRSN